MKKIALAVAALALMSTAYAHDKGNNSTYNAGGSLTVGGYVAGVNAGAGSTSTTQATAGGQSTNNGTASAGTFNTAESGAAAGGYVAKNGKEVVTTTSTYGNATHESYANSNNKGTPGNAGSGADGNNTVNAGAYSTGTYQAVQFGVNGGFSGYHGFKNGH